MVRLKIKLPTNHIYNHLTLSQEMNFGSFNNVIYKLCVYETYKISIKLGINDQQS